MKLNPLQLPNLPVKEPYVAIPGVEGYLHLQQNVAFEIKNSSDMQHIIELAENNDLTHFIQSQNNHHKAEVKDLQAIDIPLKSFMVADFISKGQVHWYGSPHCQHDAVKLGKMTLDPFYKPSDRNNAIIGFQPAIICDGNVEMQWDNTSELNKVLTALCTMNVTEFMLQDPRTPKKAKTASRIQFSQLYALTDFLWQRNRVSGFEDALVIKTDEGQIGYVYYRPSKQMKNTHLYLADQLPCSPVTNLNPDISNLDSTFEVAFNFNRFACKHCGSIEEGCEKCTGDETSAEDLQNFENNNLAGFVEDSGNYVSNDDNFNDNIGHFMEFEDIEFRRDGNSDAFMMNFAEVIRVCKNIDGNTDWNCVIVSCEQSGKYLDDDDRYLIDVRTRLLNQPAITTDFQIRCPVGTTEEQMQFFKMCLESAMKNTHCEPLDYLYPHIILEELELENKELQEQVAVIHQKQVDIQQQITNINNRGHFESGKIDWNPAMSM